MRAWRISVGALLVVGIGLGQSLQRYQNEVFTGIKVTKNVVYGRNYAYVPNQPEDLYMDIYEPAGDTAQKRPVIVLIYAGSFLPPLLQVKPLGKHP